MLQASFRRTELGIVRARSAADAGGRRQAIAAIHRETASLLDALTQNFFVHDQKGPEIQQAIACRKGCDFCCHSNVEVSIVEAIALGAWI